MSINFLRIFFCFLLSIGYAAALTSVDVNASPTSSATVSESSASKSQAHSKKKRTKLSKDDPHPHNEDILLEEHKDDDKDDDDIHDIEDEVFPVSSSLSEPHTDPKKSDSHEKSDKISTENPTSQKEKHEKSTHEKEYSKETHSDINFTVYRNGTALATKKIRADLKEGVQKIVTHHVPQTLHQDSIMATLDVPDPHIQMISSYVSKKKNDLTLLIHSDYDQAKLLTLNYLCNGLEWDVFYTGMLSFDQKTLTLHGWIELNNHCGVDIKHAQFLFDGSSTTFTPEGLTIFNQDKTGFRYLVPRALSLSKDKKTSLFFVQSPPIPLQENLTLNLGEEFLKDLNHQIYHPSVQRVLEFKNDEHSPLNMPLPEGKMTLYQMQESHMNRLLGTTTLLETRVGESVFIRAGQDPIHHGLVCDVDQTEYKKNSNKSYDMGYTVRLHNKGTVNMNLKIDLPLKNYTWTVVRSSHEYKTAPQDQGIYWDMDIPAGSTLEFKYRLKLEEKKGV